MRLCSISQKLEEALELAENISSYSAWDTMRGEMELFAESLSAHISRLMQFYMKGGQYASGAFLAMMENDRMMSQVMLSWLEKNQGCEVSERIRNQICV